MHTIKFRGKSISTGEWVYGYLLNFTGDDGNMGCYIFEDNSSEFYSIPEMLIEVDPKTVGQYIGKKDKKEREIYSDDIYIIRSYLGDDEEDYNNKYLVGYKDFSDCCVNGIGYSFGEHGSPADIEQIEVIGNLTDNPDLLTQ